MVNMSAKFDEDVHNSLVAIAFTKIRPGARTDGLTDAHTGGTAAAFVYPLRNALPGDNKVKFISNSMMCERTLNLSLSVR